MITVNGRQDVPITSIYIYRICYTVLLELVFNQYNIIIYSIELILVSLYCLFLISLEYDIINFEISLYNNKL